MNLNNNSYTVTFTSVIKIRGVNPYILVSHDRAEKIKDGWKKPMPVLVRINNLPKDFWKINMMPVGNGDFYLYLHGNVRRESKTKVGDKVIVDVVFDKEYRNGPLHPMPEWFAKELNKNSVAQKNWKTLSPSRKKEVLRYFSNLKSEEAKKRNLKRAMDVLSEKKDRFMGRLWESGK